MGQHQDVQYNPALSANASATDWASVLLCSWCGGQQGYSAGHIANQTAGTPPHTADTVCSPHRPRPPLCPLFYIIFLKSYQVGVDLERGGTISYLSSPLAPTPWTSTNLINNWDQVRECDV